MGIFSRRNNKVIHLSRYVHFCQIVNNFRKMRPIEVLIFKLLDTCIGEVNVNNFIVIIGVKPIPF